jgi:KDO2-lipid IV(A) lauroyltransferase
LARPRSPDRREDLGTVARGGRRSSGRARQLRWRLEAAGVAAAVSVLERLPEPAALAVGELAGRWAGRVAPRRRQIIRANLAAAFPTWDTGRRERVFDAHLRQLGRAAASWVRLAPLGADAILGRLAFEGVALLEEALDRGRGALVVTAHYGCFELILPGLQARLAPARMTAVSHAQRNPQLRALIDGRRRLGVATATLPQSALAVQRALRAGAAVGLLADHYLAQRRGGLLVPFLGRRAWTNPGAATLALRTGSPLILAHTRPLPDGRHLVEIGPEVVPPQSGQRARDIAAVTEQLNDVISGWIRERPELWLWAHRRFRASPDFAGATSTARARRGRGRPPATPG